MTSFEQAHYTASLEKVALLLSVHLVWLRGRTHIWLNTSTAPFISLLQKGGADLGWAIRDDQIAASEIRAMDSLHSAAGLPTRQVRFSRTFSRF